MQPKQQGLDASAACSRSNRQRGLTLVELMVATAVVALVFSAVCGVYFAVADEWTRQQGQADALVATSQACARIGDYMSLAVEADASTLSQSTVGDTLVLRIPMDLSSASRLVPSWSSAILTYQYIAFYLSDSAGNYNSTGNILWAGTVDTSVSPWKVTGDSAWSLKYGGWGSVSGLKSLRFAVLSAKPPTVTITATSSSYPAGKGRSNLTLTRTARTRNPNAG